MSAECTHTLSSGQKCHAPARHGSTFCHHHATRPHLDPNPRHTPESEPLELPPLDSKCAILTALTEVIHAASERRIKFSEARTLIMGLKFAARLMTELDRESQSASFEDEFLREPAEETLSPQPRHSSQPVTAKTASNKASSKLTASQLDDFTQRLQNSAHQHLRDQMAGPALVKVPAISDHDRALAAIAAASDSWRAPASL